MQGGPLVLPVLCEVTFVKLSVTSQKQYHVDCFLLGRFERFVTYPLSKAVVLVTRGGIIKFQGGREPYSRALQHGTFDQ